MSKKPPPRGGLTVDEYISKQRPQQQAILKQLRTLVRKTAPQLQEQVKWGFPWYLNGRENVCVIMAAGSWVDLGFYRGTELKDVRKLLDGSGKGMRHVKIHNPQDIDEQYFSDLVRQAASLKPRK